MPAPPGRSASNLNLNRVAQPVDRSMKIITTSAARLFGARPSGTPSCISLNASQALRAQKTWPLPWTNPPGLTTLLLRAHTPETIARFEWRMMTVDGRQPLVPRHWPAARAHLSARRWGAALQLRCRRGTVSQPLRPPGQSRHRRTPMGFCFLKHMRDCRPRSPATRRETFSAV